MQFIDWISTFDRLFSVSLHLDWIDDSNSTLCTAYTSFLEVSGVIAVSSKNICASWAGLLILFQKSYFVQNFHRWKTLLLSISVVNIETVSKPCQTRKRRFDVPRIFWLRLDIDINVCILFLSLQDYNIVFLELIIRVHNYLRSLVPHTWRFCSLISVCNSRRMLSKCVELVFFCCQNVKISVSVLNLLKGVLMSSNRNAGVTITSDPSSTLSPFPWQATYCVCTVYFSTTAFKLKR